MMTLPTTTKPRIHTRGGFWHVSPAGLSYSDLFPSTREERERARLVGAAASWCRMQNMGLRARVRPDAIGGKA